MSNQAARTELSEQGVLSSSYDKQFNQLTTELLGYDQTNNVLLRILTDPDGSVLPPMLTTQLDYNGGTNPIYLGQASPGTATSSAQWCIRKLTFDGNNNVTAIQYAGGASDFNQVWDNRASLSYS